MSTRGGDICDVRLDFISRRGTRFFPSPPRRNRFDFSPFRRGIDRRGVDVTFSSMIHSEKNPLVWPSKSDAQPKVRWHEYPVVSFGSELNNAASLSPRFAQKCTGSDKQQGRFNRIGQFASSSSSSLIEIKKNNDNISSFAEPGSWKMASYGHLEPIDSVAHGKVHAPLGTGT